MTTTTPTFNAQYFNALIDQLWNGTIGESDFIQESLSLGITRPHVETVLDDLREVDGTLSFASNMEDV